MPCDTLNSAGYHAVSEVDVPLTYADYYYLEAILRLLDEIQYSENTDCFRLLFISVNVFLQIGCSFLAFPSSKG